MNLILRLIISFLLSAKKLRALFWLAADIRLVKAKRRITLIFKLYQIKLIVKWLSFWFNPRSETNVDVHMPRYIDLDSTLFLLHCSHLRLSSACLPCLSCKTNPRKSDVCFLSAVSRLWTSSSCPQCPVFQLGRKNDFQTFSTSRFKNKCYDRCFIG